MTSLPHLIPSQETTAHKPLSVGLGLLISLAATCAFWAVVLAPLWSN